MEGLVFLTPGKEKEIGTNQLFPLGTCGQTGDGRRFVYALAGATNIAAGKVVQPPAVDGNFDELVTAAAAAGATSVTVTTGATAVTANLFLNGYLQVEDDAGEGHLYLIGEHGAVATSSAFAVPLAPGETVKVAITANTTCALIRNPFSGLVIQPSPPTTMAVGVTPTALTAANYGWIQTYGMTSVLADGTLVVGKTCMASDSVDGAVEDFILAEGTPNTLANSQIVGVVQEISATTEHSTVFLTIG